MIFRTAAENHQSQSEMAAIEDIQLLAKWLVILGFSGCTIDLLTLLIACYYHFDIRNNQCFACFKVWSIFFFLILNLLGTVWLVMIIPKDEDDDLVRKIWNFTLIIILLNWIGFVFDLSYLYQLFLMELLGNITSETQPKIEELEFEEIH
jgi:hypothetical protein